MRDRPPAILSPASLPPFERGSQARSTPHAISSPCEIGRPCSLSPTASLSTRVRVRVRERGLGLGFRLSVSVSIIRPLDVNVVIPNIYMSSSGIRVQLYFTAHDLYFVGFRVNGKDFVTGHQELFKEQVKLGFDLRYQDFGVGNLDKVNISRAQLQDAVLKFDEASKMIVPPSPRSDKVSCKDFGIPLDSCSENHQVYMQPAEEGGFHYPHNSMSKDSCLEPDRFPQGEEHAQQEMQAVAEQVVASVLQSSSTVPAPLCCEEKDSDPQSNRVSGPVGNNVSLKSATLLGKQKIEDMKNKQSDKVNLGFPVTDNIGRLQIIKNSDLEELRELGSGTFGTVYHGKWRGSDVAIKRINNRCFAGKPSEEERMRADFWNEACKLADLHHPNVVAFYGVILDGPGGSFATVTEFMVNGSLRQAIQRYDRSIDRRKRLVIAMDVAFGMVKILSTLT